MWFVTKNSSKFYLSNLNKYTLYTCMLMTFPSALCLVKYNEEIRHLDTCTKNVITFMEDQNINSLLQGQSRMVATSSEALELSDANRWCCSASVWIKAAFWTFQAN